MMAEQWNKTGVIAWFSAGMKAAIVASGMDWLPIAGVLVLVFVFSHYFFASTTAHISAMLLAFLTVGLHLIPAQYHVPFMLMMTAGSAIMMTLTHYATGTSPIIFGSGFVTMGNWWRVGFIMCVVEGAGLLVRQAAAWPPGSAPAHAVLSGACSAHLSAIRA
jgi:DASS family divalent anion:Na+ symporter